MVDQIVFDQAQHVSIGQMLARIEQDEAVERVAVTRRVHRGGDDRITESGEESANPGEQLRLIRHINHHLDALAGAVDAGADHGLAALRAMVERVHVPGNLVGIVLEEVAGVQPLPERLLGARAQPSALQQRPRFLLSLRDAGHLGRCVAAQQLRAGAQQVFQQLALPGVPNLWTGAADIRHGEQIEGNQAPFGSNHGGEAADDVRVGEILLLRHLRHGQMLADQEDHQVGVLADDTVGAAESPGIGHAEPRVIAAASLGDVVEQRGDIQQPGFVEAAHQPRAERVFVGKVSHGETPQVAHDLQDVLIDGVGMEQVVLHLPDDAAEGRQVVAENVVLVHPPEFMDQAALFLEQGHEQPRCRRRAPQRGTGELARSPERAQGACRHAT